MYGMKLLICGVCLIVLAAVLGVIGWRCHQRERQRENDKRIEMFGRLCVELAQQQTVKTPLHGARKLDRKEAAS